MARTYRKRKDYRIALAFNQNHPQLAPVRKGIFRYAREKKVFRFVFNIEMGLSVLRELPAWGGDGIVGHLTTPEQLEVARQIQIPFVNYGGALEAPPFPTVHSDYRTEGRRAARHLMARGFSHFAYLGAGHLWYSRQRLAGFQQTLHEEGTSCAIHLQTQAQGLQDEEEAFNHLKAWLNRLPLPIGMMVDRDVRSVQLYEACWELGLDIPSDLALLGVDNDPLVTHAYSPSLTSLAVRHEEVGYRVMVLLHRLIEGDNKVPQEEIVPAGEMVERGSTDTVVVHDPELRRVVDRMREMADKPYGLKGMLAELGVSRRWLERGFQRHVGQTPASFLLQIRLSRAKQYLREHPELNLAEVVERTGFYSKRHFVEVFERVEGRKPLDYRAAMRAGW